MQRILLPWEHKKWSEHKRRLTDPISSIVDMDAKISAICPGRLKPRTITQLFTALYSDEAHVKTVPQDTFIGKVLPWMQKLVIEGQRIFRGVDTRLVTNSATAYTRPQVATLLACIWFGLFDGENYLSKGPVTYASMPEPSFVNLFVRGNIFALQCMINYFGRAYEYAHAENASTWSQGVIIIKHRRGVEPDWALSDKPLAEIMIGEGMAHDDSPARLHTVYAQDVIGGDNIFGETITQLETTLLIRPEALVATIFCPRVDEASAYVLFGAEKMSHYAGYGASIRFVGNYEDSTPRGQSRLGTLTQIALAFIDASPRSSSKSQFSDDFLRDMNKAYYGMSAYGASTDVATGNWASPTGSNMQLKFIQQLLAASEADCALIYHPFGAEFEATVTTFATWLAQNNITVCMLLRMYLDLIVSCGTASRLSNLDIFECIMDGCT